MSGAGLTYDFRGLEALQQRINKLAKGDRKKLLDVIGATVESQTRRRIQEEKESPEGDAWPAWSDNYAARRPEGASLLMSTDHLLDSITFLKEDKNSVAVGSNIIYAATHQFGDEDRNIPARPYLGVSDDNEKDLIRDVDDYLDGLIR